MLREGKNDGIAAKVVAMSIFSICALMLNNSELNDYSV